MLYILILKQEMYVGMSVNLGVLVKGKVFPIHILKVYGGVKVQLHLFLASTPREETRDPFSMRLVLPDIRSGRFGEHMNGNLRTCSK